MLLSGSVQHTCGLQRREPREGGQHDLWVWLLDQRVSDAVGLPIDGGGGVHHDPQQALRRAAERDGVVVEYRGVPGVQRLLQHPCRAALRSKCLDVAADDPRIGGGICLCLLPLLPLVNCQWLPIGSLCVCRRAVVHIWHQHALELEQTIFVDHPR